MLDFHGLFPSYVALFPGGVYMEIESLRLDLHLKRKQKKPQGQHQRFHRRRKKKKKKKPREDGVRRRKEKKKPDARPGFAAQRPGSRDHLGRATRDPGGRASPRDQVAPRPSSLRGEPRSRIWVFFFSFLSSSNTFFSGFFFFFFFLLRCCPCGFFCFLFKCKSSLRDSISM